MHDGGRGTVHCLEVSLLAEFIISRLAFVLIIASFYSSRQVHAKV